MNQVAYINSHNSILDFNGLKVKVQENISVNTHISNLGADIDYQFLLHYMSIEHEDLFSHAKGDCIEVLVSWQEGLSTKYGLLVFDVKLGEDADINLRPEWLITVSHKEANMIKESLGKDHIGFTDFDNGFTIDMSRY